MRPTNKKIISPFRWLLPAVLFLQAGSADDPAVVRSALETDAKFAPALLGMARLSFDKGDFMAARAYNQRFADIAKETPESLLLGVRTEMKLGDAGAASVYELKLRAKFPDSTEVQVLRDLKRP